MNLKHFYLFLCLLLSLVIHGCGQGGGGGEGLNGGLELTASVSGAIVTATATYTNPTETNLIGVPITFSADFGPIGTFNTNNSGSVGVAFTPPAFNGTKTFAVIATTGNLSQFATVTMTGRLLTLAVPPNQGPVTATENPGQFHTFSLSSQNFVTITDPFSNDISGHPIIISAVFSSTDPDDRLLFGANPSVGPGETTLTTVATGASGVAPLPSASLVMVVPNAGVTKTATISWTATDFETGLSGSGTTVVTLTK